MTQRLFRNFDADFIRAVAMVNDVVDLGHAQQVVTDLVAQRLAAEVVEIAVQRDHDDRPVHFLLVDDRFLGQRRKRRDRIDASFHICQQLVNVRIRVQFDRYLADPFKGIRANLLDADEILDGILDL